MKANSATMIGAYVQSLLLLDKPYEFVPNTTLNERHEVQAGVVPNQTERMALRYFAIGKRGHRNAIGGDGQPYTTEELYDARFMSLYDPIPFVIRPIEQDLSPAERQKFGMRVIEVLNGRKYACYYLRAFDLSRVTPMMLLNLVNGTEITSRPFIPTRDHLFPTPPTIPTNEATEVSGEYGSVSTVLEAILSAVDVEEVIEACRIKYNNPNYAIMSEVGLVAASQRMVEGEGVGNQTINYVEALCATLLSWTSTYHNLPGSSRGVKETLEMGSTEPTLLNSAVSGG